MLGKILVPILALLALIGGAAGGSFLRGDPAPAETEAHDTTAHAHEAKKSDSHGAKAEAGGHGEGEAAAKASFRFPQQFFVPMVRDGSLNATMVLSLSVEMPGAASESVFAQEFKLRDALLRALLVQANTGGFDGNFTSETTLQPLREKLLAAAQSVEPQISEVLIGDIARQQ